MSQTQKVECDYALGIARRIVGALEDVCERIEIAGSLRRKAAQVGDIEIVAVAKVFDDLLGGRGESKLAARLTRLWRQRKLLGGKPLKDGPKFKQFEIASPPARLLAPLKLDLFIVEPDSWGLQLAIRTGPAEFSKRLVTEQSRGGLLRDGLKSAGGVLYRGRIEHNGELLAAGVPIPTPEERAFLEEYCGGWIEPEERNERFQD